jgi:hypothetical protein
MQTSSAQRFGPGVRRRLHSITGVQSPIRAPGLEAMAGSSLWPSARQKCHGGMAPFAALSRAHLLARLGVREIDMRTKGDGIERVGGPLIIGTLRRAVSSLVALAPNARSRAKRTSEQELFDVEHGTDTGGCIRGWSLDVPGEAAPHVTGYQATKEKHFRQMLDQLPIDARSFVFIDLGSGKGRALLLAARFPFREIIGVEISRQLSAIAARNVAAVEQLMTGGPPIRPLCMDARQYELPLENIVLYLFHPFQREVLLAVRAKIESWLLATERELFVIYHRPMHRELLDSVPFLEILSDMERFVIYRRSVAAFDPNK